MATPSVRVKSVTHEDKINIDQACEEIRKALGSARDSIWQIVDLIRECTNKEGFKALQVELEARNIMKQSVFSMFKGIAENSLMDYNRYGALLPPAYNTLYHLAKIEDDKVFDAYIKEEKISPATKLEDAKRLVQESKGSSTVSANTKKPPRMISFTCKRIDEKEYKKNKTKIDELLSQLNALGVLISVNNGK